MDVGTALQDAREQRGLSLDQLSQATKISVRILRAIEHNRMDQLPDGIFLRGFLRAYAREVGLNPEDTVGRYLGQSEPVPAAKRGSGEARTQPGPAVQGEIDQAAPERHAARVPWLVGMVVLVISLVGSYTFTRWWPSPPPPVLPVTHPPAAAIAITRASSPADSSTPAAADRPEAATVGSPEPTTAASGGELFRVDIRSQGLCWLSATVDGARVVYRLMQPGEQQTIEVDNEAVLRVGNPAAFTLSINGRAGRSLGQADEAVTVHITKQNYREFLRR